MWTKEIGVDGKNIDSVGGLGRAGGWVGWHIAHLELNLSGQLHKYMLMEHFRVYLGRRSFIDS